MGKFNWKEATPTRSIQKTRDEIAGVHKAFGDEEDPSGQVAALDRAMEYIAELEAENKRLRDLLIACDETFGDHGRESYWNLKQDIRTTLSNRSQR